MIICMIMRKNENSAKKTDFFLSRATRIVYFFGMLILAVPLFYLTVQVTSHTTLTLREVKLYALALEHILAGLTLLTGGCYLVERVTRAMQEKE